MELEADVTLLWIPSHCGIQGNDKADELAKLGTTLDQTGVPVSRKIVKAKIKSRTWQITHPRAQSIFGNRRSPKLEVERKWSRRVRCLYSRLRSGHANELKEYRHRILQKEDDPNCETCGVPEDTEHVLCHCACTEEARVRNWNEEMNMRMMVDEPDVCRKILGARFPALLEKKHC